MALPSCNAYQANRRYLERDNAHRGRPRLWRTYTLRTCRREDYEMTMRRFHVDVIAAGLLVLISGPSFAAHKSRHPSSRHSQSAVKKNRGLVPSPYKSRVLAFDYRLRTMCGYDFRKEQSLLSDRQISFGYPYLYEKPSNQFSARSMK